MFFRAAEGGWTQERLNALAPADTVIRPSLERASQSLPHGRCAALAVPAFGNQGSRKRTCDNRQPGAEGPCQPLVREKSQVERRETCTGTCVEIAETISPSPSIVRNPGPNLAVPRSPTLRRCAPVARFSMARTMTSRSNSSIFAATSTTSDESTDWDSRSVPSDAERHTGYSAVRSVQSNDRFRRSAAIQWHRGEEPLATPCGPSTAR